MSVCPPRFSFLQVHLEAAPDSRDVTSPQDFDELKASNALRYEVLREILSCLGLSCEQSHVPPPSPIYVLSSSEVGPTALTPAFK